MPDTIVELDGTRPPAPRRADRFVVGAILTGSLVFAVGVMLGRPISTPLTGVAASPAPTAPSIAPVRTPLPFPTARFRGQPPIFIRPSGAPDLPSVPPDRSFIPAPGDTWRFYGGP